MKLLRDSWLVFARQMALVLRNPVWLIVGVMQPLYFLLLFGPLLKGVANLPGGNAYQFFVPGLLVQLAMFGTLFVGFALIAELRAGVIERMRVTPVSRLALLLGRSGRDVASLLVQAAIMTALSVPFGLTVKLGSLTIFDVWFVPELRVNLISVDAFNSQGYDVNCKRTGEAWIVDEAG